MTDLVLATGNPHKTDELRAIFAAAALRVRVHSFADLSPIVPFTEPPETGTTFAENASIKARSYAAQTGRPCLADDSGIEIDALDGRPGVISSHYYSDGLETGLSRPERDAANNARVLRELVGLAFPSRSARFVCTMCLALPDGSILATSRGTFEGRIGFQPNDPVLNQQWTGRPDRLDPVALIVPRGTHGFGYDPLFLVAPDFLLTSAELTPEVKNRLSHRAAAAARLVEVLRSL